VRGGGGEERERRILQATQKGERQRKMVRSAQLRRPDYNAGERNAQKNQKKARRGEDGPVLTIPGTSTTTRHGGEETRTRRNAPFRVWLEQGPKKKKRPTGKRPKIIKPIHDRQNRCSAT